MDKLKNSVTNFLNNLQQKKTTHNSPNIRQQNNALINHLQEDDGKSVGSHHSFEMVDTKTTTEAIEKDKQKQKKQQQKNDVFALIQGNLTQKDKNQAISEDNLHGVELKNISHEK